jgi:hypothetical protein
MPRPTSSRSAGRFRRPKSRFVRRSLRHAMAASAAAGLCRSWCSLANEFRVRGPGPRPWRAVITAPCFVRPAAQARGVSCHGSLPTITRRSYIKSPMSGSAAAASRRGVSARTLAARMATSWVRESGRESRIYRRIGLSPRGPRWEPDQESASITGNRAAPSGARRGHRRAATQ